jgi:STE24 endopeptidase
MSETTATRIATPHSVVRGLVVVLALAGWVAAALALWRTQVPADLRLPHVDVHRYFRAAELTRTARYERFVRVDLLLASAAELVALALLARRGPRLARSLRLGRVGSGIVVGMLVVTVLAFVEAPFAVAARWWEVRHDLTLGGWTGSLVGQWLTLLATALATMLVTAIVMPLAARFPRRWWVPAAATLSVLALLFTLLAGALAAVAAHPVRGARLRAEARQLERRTGTRGTPVEVEKVSDETRQANALTVGIGPSERVVLWNTLLDGRFPPGEVRVVLAHELGHVARHHVWKGIAWFGLFGLPGSLLLAVATRRAGGLGKAGVLPLGFLVLAVIQLVTLPAANLVSRRYEAEADWIALRTTRDPKAAAGLFARFAQTSLAQPSPPSWAYVLLATHPTIAQRIAMAEIFTSRNSPGNSRSANDSAGAQGR